MDYNVALPSKPRIVKEEDHTGVYEIDGLFPGYGHTLGNSLRRIILSSLTGAAITSVKIEGASHEFATLDGVQEDVVLMLLNLKRLRFTTTSDEPQVLTLEKKGVGPVTGADITSTGQVTLVNPEQHIAEITNAHTTLSMEITVERGLGYVPREMRQQQKMDVGVIALDSAFSPIRRVNYEVENMRVGNRTDYNRLRILIETDGTVEPRGALEKSIEIMIHQLKSIIGFKEEVYVDEREDVEAHAEYAPEPHKAQSSKSQPDAEALKTRIETLTNLSARTINALVNANIRTIGGLARKREEDILAIEGLGLKGLQEIKRALSDFGIVLR